MTDFADIVQSLNINDPRANISAIKGALKEQFQETDTRVRVEVTDHFNHSYVPDLLLSWPGTKDTRNVFLRTAFREDDLRRDIDVLGEQRPILLSLDRLPEREDTGTELQSRAKESNSLVADPYGLEALDEEAADKPVVTLLSHAVIQGGRGVMSAGSARASGTSVDAGFDGARSGDATATSAAVENAADLLDSFRASQINRLLHAVWLGSGQSGSTFPGAPGITAVLDAESLRFVLELPGIADDEFFSRLGSGLTTNRLCELRDFEATDNLQRLIAGNAHRLTAKACRIVAQPGQGVAGPAWSVRNSNLVLAVEDDLMFFAPHALSELPAATDAPPEVTVNQLQSRARAADLRLGEVRLSDGDHSLAYGAEEDADVAQAEALASVQALLPNAALIAATAIAGTKEVRCTFRTRTAAGNASAKFLVSELVDVAMPLLVAPAREVIDDVRALLERPEIGEASGAPDPSVTSIDS